jgi:hypothetical protein
MSARLATNWDALAAAEPLNRDAAIVVAQGREAAPTRTMPAHVAHSDVPLPMRPWSGDGPNLTGKTFGRLRCIGIFEPENRAKNTRLTWVVKCACGTYENRRLKALDRATYLMCAACARLEILKVADRERAQGKSKRGPVGGKDQWVSVR